MSTHFFLSYSFGSIYCFSLSLTTYYGFYVAAASACTNAFTIAIITIVLASVPTSVLPSLRGEKRPARAGDVQLAGGSRESHLTSKQTDRSRRLPVLLLLLPFFTPHIAHQCRQPNKNSPLPRFSASSLGKEKWPQDCQEASVGKTGPSLPTVCSSFTDLSCSMTACHSLGLGDEDFAARTAVLNFGYGRCTPPFALDGFALSLSSLSARCGLSFCFTSCLHPAFYAFANLTLKNGRLKCPFSASNFDIRCHDLLHMSNPLGFTLFHRAFHHCSARDGSFLRLANLTLKNGRCKCPFSASNCVIRCHSLLESPSDKGFYHQCLCLTLMDGGCVLQLRLRSSNSLTCILPFLASNCVIPCQFTTGGLYCQFSASNCVIPCHFTDENLLLQFLASNCVILCQFTEGTCSYQFSASSFDSRCQSTAGSLYLQFLASNCVTRCQFTEGSCDFPFLTSICVIRCHVSIPSCVPCMVRCDSLACIVSPQLLLGSSVLPTLVLDVCVLLLLACFASRHCTSRVDSLASISLTLPATDAFPSLTCMTSHLCRTLTVTSASTLSFTCMFLLVAWLASDVCASLVGSSARTPSHIISTPAGDAPLLLGIFYRKVPTLPCHNAMELNEQSSTLLTLVCSLLVSMTLIVSILVRSDTSIGCMKNSWRGLPLPQLLSAEWQHDQLPSLFATLICGELFYLQLSRDPGE